MTGESPAPLPTPRPERLARGVDRFVARRAALKRRLGRAAVLLPLVSLAWGVLSAVTLARDFAHSRALLASFAGFVVAAAALRAWRGVAATRPPRTALGRALAGRPELVAGTARQVMQFCAQYVLAFGLPLMLAAGAYGTFAVTALVLATTLWDKAWRALAHHAWYEALVRCLGGALACSFCFGVLWPHALGAFYATLAGVVLGAAAPWGALWQRRRPDLHDLAPTAAAACVVILAAAVEAPLRYPLLSIWLRRPAIGFGVVGRELATPLGPTATRAAVEAGLARGAPLCCVTPIVAPSGLDPEIVHEWRLDGALVERIVLPRGRGLGDAAGGYRTFSCKERWPALTGHARIRCRVFVGGGVYVGEASLPLE